MWMFVMRQECKPEEDQIVSENVLHQQNNTGKMIQKVHEKSPLQIINPKYTHPKNIITR